MGVALRIFFVGGLISFRALFGFMSLWVFVPTLVVTPIFQILLFTFIGRSAGLESDEFYVLGNALQYASVPCLFAMSQTIAGERNQQTLGYILVSPAGRLPLFLGRAMPVIVNGFFVAAFSLTVSSVILGIDLPAGSIAPLVLVIAASTFSCTDSDWLRQGLDSSSGRPPCSRTSSSGCCSSSREQTCRYTRCRAGCQRSRKGSRSRTASTRLVRWPTGPASGMSEARSVRSCSSARSMRRSATWCYEGSNEGAEATARWSAPKNSNQNKARPLFVTGE